tara:strand:+ start:98 stop:382 length:285 start_codon:yes stop_codon:yes gene_type:complete
MSDLSATELQDFIIETANKYAAIIIVYLKRTEQKLSTNMARAAMELVAAYESRASNEDVWKAYHELIQTAKSEGIDLDKIALAMMHNYIGLQNG